MIQPPPTTTLHARMRTAGLDCDGDCLVDSDQRPDLRPRRSHGLPGRYCLQLRMQQRRMQVTAITPKRTTTAQGNCLNDSDQDGICDALEVELAAPTARLATMIPTPPTTTLHARLLNCGSRLRMATAWLTRINDQICDQDEVTGCQDDSCLQLRSNSDGCRLLRLPRNELRLPWQLLERLRSGWHLRCALRFEGCTTPSACNYNCCGH